MSKWLKKQKQHKRYSWRDYAIGSYFAYILALGALGLHGRTRLLTYSISSIIIGLIGVAAVGLKLRRLEATMLITWGSLLMARALLLIPASTTADNHGVVDFLVDIFSNRPLADGVSAILVFVVLASYRCVRCRWKESAK